MSEDVRDGDAPLLTVLMGPPGAGKTTYRATIGGDPYVADTHAVRMVDELDVSAYMDAFRRRAVAELRAGRDVVVDATNCYPQHRRYWLTVAARLGARTRLVVFATALPLMLAAQRRRAHPAPDRVVRRHHAMMVAALPRLHVEGWDEVEVIRRP